MSKKTQTLFVENKNGHCRLCDKKDTQEMVQCDECDRWFHFECAKLKTKPKEEDDFVCVKCSADRIIFAPPPSAGSSKGKADASQLAIMALVETLRENNTFGARQLKRASLNELPYFDGKAREWPKFKRVFEQTTRDAGFSDLENLTRLQRCLKGNAEKSVRALFLDPENVDLIMARLEEQFGRTDQVYKELLKEVTRARGDFDHIPELSDAVENLVINIMAMEKHAYLHDPRLIDELVAKLPADKQISWIEHRRATEKRESVTLKHFSNWLMPIACNIRLLPRATDRKPINLHKDQPAKTTSKPSRFGNKANKGQTPLKPRECLDCKGPHSLLNCEQFKGKLPRERFEIAKKSNLCLGCLKSTKHNLEDCWSARECGTQDCKLKHHPLIHVPSDGSVLLHYTGSKVYYQILPVVLRNGKITKNTFALLDNGSSSTLVEQTMADQLNLKGAIDPLTLTWTQSLSINESDSRRVEFRIRGLNESKEYTLQAARTVSQLNLPTQTIDSREMKRRFPHLSSVNIASYEDARPTILIGLNNNHLMMPLNQRIGKNAEPIAVRTKLGWTIFGVERRNYIDSPNYLMIHESEDAMNTLIRSYFSTESLGVNAVNPALSHEQTRTNEIIEKTLVRKNDRYEVGLLWKTDDIKLPPSYNNAFRRLQCLEKQLKKDASLKEWAPKTFRDHQAKGYLRKLSKKEIGLESPRTFYLPHFIVINKNKPIPKPRLVFDAAAEVKGVSLNSALMSGPDINAPLFGVLIRFREGQIGVTGDIKEMFHQVRIRKEDQDAQRILWRDCEDRKPDVFVMQVMTFGATCSPACAQIVKNHNAAQHKHTHPKAEPAIVRQHYVDDYLDSFMNLEDAKETVDQVIEVHKKGGFEIRNFISNSTELINAIDGTKANSNDSIVVLKKKDCNIEKVLGVYWNTETDQLGYHVNFRGIDSIPLPTKRQVLSFVMSMFDPLGLISHITIHGRLLVKLINLAVEEWDQTISNDQHIKRWKEWLLMAANAKTVKIPRAITPHAVQRPELHTFVDASEEAFAACVYLRTCHEGIYTVRLLAGKAKVAPTPVLSIPRLELQAAVIGARLAETVVKELRISITRKVYWSDSQTVLAWINSAERKYHQFVALRVSEILDTCTMSQWRWVPTKRNPADIATKKVEDDSPWYNGPDFLREDESLWPTSKVSYSTGEEARVMLHQENRAVLNEHDYSDWGKLVDHLLYLRKFGQFVTKRSTFSKRISLEDVQQVKNHLYRKAQWEGFPEEMKLLTSNNGVQKSSSIKKLSPFIDESGVMRSQGRLENIAALPPSARTPIILPQKHRLTKLLVRHYHQQCMHQADNVVIAKIRQHFWILNLRAVLKNVKSCCQRCILRNAKPVAPQMAPLPNFRAMPYTPPFTHTGVDYFGPLEVSVKRSTEKRWGAIFTCMSTRAVYIDLAEKLDTDSFLVCLKNMQCRRGKIAHLYSDNGTNFVGAEKELQRLVNEIDQYMGQAAARKYDLQWHFNPPSAPHFGGAWERLIRSVKKGLRHMSEQWKNRKPSPSTLRAALIQIEALINARPLTHIPLGNEEDEPLTPFHFLIGRSGEYVPPQTVFSSAMEKAQYHLAQHHTKVFWDRWKKEYLPTLIQRDKWTNRIEPIKKDDIVVLAEDNGPPGKWLRGRVEEVETAPDGQVRKVRVKVGGKVIERPAIKVAVLNVKKKEHLLLHQNSSEPTNGGPSNRASESTNGGPSTRRGESTNGGPSNRMSEPTSKRPNNQDTEAPPAKRRPRTIRPCTWAKNLI